jgi:type IV pilus assembly protein PilM
MSKNNVAWGIELGADAIKAMRLTRTPEGIDLTDYEVVAFKQILTTPDMNVDEAIQVNLDAFLQKHDLKGSTVVVSVPGNMAFARFAKLPPVDPKKIPDIVKFEAVQQIPFPIDQVEWDYQVFQQPDSPDVEVGIFAITKDRVMQWLSHFRRAGITVDGLTLSPLAVFNAFHYDLNVKDDDEGVILMDIGTSSTDVVIVERGGIWLRTLPMGGNAFTEALVRAFKLSFPKAEKLKREAATSKYARQIFQAMRPVFADLVQEIQRSLGYYQSLNRDANLTKLIGVGSTFKLPGLQKFLKQQLQMEVVRPDKFERIRVEGKQESDLAENALKMATAYGLALQGLGMEKVGANLLPSFIMKQRMWKAKQPWMAAAAVLCLLASGAAAYKLFTDKSTFADAERTEAPRIRSVLSAAQSYGREWEQLQGSADPRQRIENLRRILDYRDVWPKILADITLAAESLKPQIETLGSDYDALLKIPRKERRRIYIDSVTTRYVVSTPVTTTEMAGPVGPQPSMGTRLEDFNWGGSPDFAPPTPSRMMEMPEPHTDTASRQPPRFELEIRGTTPYGRTQGEVASFLTQGLVEWLKQNNERPDRPYKLVGVNTAVVDIRPVASEARASQIGAPAAPVGVVGGPGIRGGAPPVRGRGGLQQPGFETATGGGAITQTLTLADLLPTGPTRQEATTGDHEFIIRWTVQLIRPEDARQSEEAAGTRRERRERRDRSSDATVETSLPDEETDVSSDSAPTTDNND